VPLVLRICLSISWQNQRYYRLWLEGLHRSLKSVFCKSMDVLFVYLIDGLYFILQWFVQFIKSVLYF